MEKIKNIIASQTIKDTGLSFFGLGFTALVGFIYTVIIAKYFGPNNFGIYSAIVAFMTIAFAILDLGISSAIVNFLPKNPKDRHKYLNTSFTIQLAVGVLMIFIFWLISLKPWLFIPGATSNALLISGLLGFNYVFIGFIQGVFSAERKFFRYSLTQVIDAGLKILIIGLLIVSNKLSIELALLANVISTIFSFVITYFNEIPRIRIEFHKTIFDLIFHFAKWIAVNRIFSVFVSRIDVIFLNLLASSYEAGIYAAASRITMLFSLLISSLGSVVNPRFSAFDNNEKILTYIKKLFLLVSVVCVLMLLLVLLAKPVILIVFGEKFISAVKVFQWLTVAMIPFVYTLITIPALIYSFNQPKFVAQLTVVQVVTIVVIDLLFIPRLGALTPALSIGISNVLVLTLSVNKLHNLFSTHE